MNIAAWLEALFGDLQYGLRQLRLAPGFAAVAILSLARLMANLSGGFGILAALLSTPACME